MLEECTGGSNSVLIDRTAIHGEQCACNEVNMASNISAIGELSKSKKRKQSNYVDEYDHNKEEGVSTKPKD